MVSVETIIKEFISVNFYVDFEEDGITNDADLFKSDVIDSLGFVRLVSFLERTFELAIPDDDLESVSFTNLSGICKYIQSNSTSK